jgi:hypothetical protein
MSLSLESAIISGIRRTRPTQNAACMQREPTRRTEIPCPSWTICISANGRGSAVSVPSNPIRERVVVLGDDLLLADERDAAVDEVRAVAQHDDLPRLPRRPDAAFERHVLEARPDGRFAVARRQLHQVDRERLQRVHLAGRDREQARAAVERLVEQVQDRRVRLVELVEPGADLAAVWVVGAARVRAHVVHGVPVDRERLARRPRLRRVAERVAPAEVDLLEAEVVRDLLPLGMEHVAVAVPDLLVLEPFALLDDLPERLQRRREVGDGDDPAAAAVVQLVGDLTGGVAAEERLFAELVAQPNERLLDRLVELADRLELVVLQQAVMLVGALDPHEGLDGLRRELLERHLERAIAVRQEGRICRQHARRVDRGRAADRVEHVRDQRHVQHLLHEDAAHDLRGRRVGVLADGVQRTQVGRDRRVLELERPLQMLVQRFGRIDGHRAAA